MQFSDFDYVKPTTLEEGLELLQKSKGKAQILAGGTDVLFNMKMGLFQPETLINIKSLPELTNVEEQSDGTLRIGTCCRLTTLIDHPLIVERYPALNKTIKGIASWHVRNMATIGGNLCLDTRCWYTNQSKEWRDARELCFKTDGNICHVIKSSPDCVAINSSDSALILMVMDTHVTAAKVGATRDIPLVDFYRDDGMDHTVLEPDEILTMITVPPCSDRLMFSKIAPREGLDFSLGAIAAGVNQSGDKISTVKLVIGSLISQPLMLKNTAKIVLDGGLSDDVIESAAEHAVEEAGLLTNLYSIVAYKRELIKALVKRALTELRGD